ncbi:MAG: heme-binding domain-containing protein [Bacteroidetes bacterium]|nr:heme-binding domain-containing protein [Bacteroidota bacterium]
MKTFFFILISLFMVTMTVTIVATPHSTRTSDIFISADDGQPLADSVMNIVKNACMDCHADGGNGMASSRVNFSKWTTYNADKQASKANAICKELTKRGMPPKKFCESHPDAVPTQAQVTTICNWAKALNK